MTLQQIKDEYAKEFRYPTWYELLDRSCALERHIDQIAKRYAKQEGKIERDMYKECLENFVPFDMWDDVQNFLSSYGCGIAKDIQNREL